MRVRLRLSGSVASHTLKYSAIPRLDSAHRQTRGRADLVARVGQVGQRHGVFEPLHPGRGHACTYTKEEVVCFRFPNRTPADLKLPY